MKVAFLLNEFPSLSETFILNQISGLIEAGHRVDLYARNAQAASKVHPLVEKYQLTNIVYYHPYIPANYLARYLKAVWLVLMYLWTAPLVILRALNFRKFGRHATSLKLLYRSISFVRRGCPSYDIIMCHFGPMGLIALDLKAIQATDGKVCVAFHGLDLSAHLQAEGKDVYNPLFEKGDLFLPISYFWEKRLIELGCDPKKIKTHRMGIDVEQFSFKPRALSNDRTVRLVSVARLVEKKGIEYGIRALEDVVKHYPNIEYVIIGDGPLMPKLSQLVRDLELDEVVHLLGWQRQDEVVEILSHSHILLAPSVTGHDGDMEGIPVILMEAMASGLPVISTWHSGIPELVRHGESGFLVPERDSSALSEQISNLIQKSEIWSQMGQNARLRVAKEFDVNQLNKQLNKIFLQILH